MKLTAYAGLSAALAVSVVTHAVVTRKQFYPAVIYLATSKFSILVMKLLSSLSLVSFSNAPRYWILQMFLKLYETARASRSSVAARFAAMDSSVRPVICGGESGGQSCPFLGTRVGDRERDGSGFAHPLTSRPA